MLRDKLMIGKMNERERILMHDVKIERYEVE